MASAFRICILSFSLILILSFILILNLIQIFGFVLVLILVQEVTWGGGGAGDAGDAGDAGGGGGSRRLGQDSVFLEFRA